MIDRPRSGYECIGVKLFSDEGLYAGRGLIRYATIEFSSERVSGLMPIKRTVDLIVNSKGLTKVERKIRNHLISERISIPENLSKIVRSYQNQN